MSETRKVELAVTIEVDPDMNTSELAETVLEVLHHELDFAHSVKVGPAVTRPEKRGLRIGLRFK